MGGLLDGVPLNNKTLVIKAAHCVAFFISGSRESSATCFVDKSSP
uniref:Trypsin n=1 Tax=Siphoviridae sp. ctUlD12 TaxID=2826354 RepID=A0A8S5MLZ2_9CAUD|nr:MAG TPA: Trypsin [Siphoviridae sp. ctUlD12]